MILKEKEKELQLHEMKRKEVIGLINSNHQPGEANKEQNKNNKTKKIQSLRGRDGGKLEVDNDGVIEGI
jgi:hypothetical protein